MTRKMIQKSKKNINKRKYRVKLTSLNKNNKGAVVLDQIVYGKKASKILEVTE